MFLQVAHFLNGPLAPRLGTWDPHWDWKKVGRTEGKEDLESWMLQPGEGMSPQS